MTAASTLKSIRLIHLYIGVFLTPAILFFCFSGALQTLNYNDNNGSYRPPHWLSVVAQLHKKQTIVLPERRPAPPATAPKVAAPQPTAPPAPPSPAPKKHNVWPMKIFFLFTTVGLAFSSLLGLYMSYKFNRNRTAVTLTLLAGIVIPIALMFF